MIDCDVVLIICSRRREEVLTRLLGDLQQSFIPALDAGGLTSCIFIYAQGYAPNYLASLAQQFADGVAAQKLIVTAPTRPHTRIGDVVQTAIRTVHDCARYKLAMLMDDDSTYDADPVVDANVRRAARNFIECNHRAYSIKLGASHELEYRPFVDLSDPIMPFKEKMLWASYQVLAEVLETPRFSELSIGEDAVIAAVAWLSDPDACFAVDGIATFLHLGFERPPELGDQDIEGGYADLMNYDPRGGALHGKYDMALRTGVTPFHIMPDVFVPEDHPRYIFNGIRGKVVVGMGPSVKL